MKKTILLLTIYVSIFAQSDFEYLQSVMPKDSIVRANFIQTKTVKSLEKPLVSQGKILSVKNKGVVWLIENPTYIKKAILFDDNSAKSQYAMIAPFFSGDVSTLQKRFEHELTKASDVWTLKITPKSATVRKNVKYITISSSLNNEFQDVLIFSGDESFVKINFISDIATNQFLSKEEEALFEQE
jgi:hypothetical protein